MAKFQARAEWKSLILQGEMIWEEFNGILGRAVGSRGSD
jgi:hypothetical protein